MNTEQLRAELLPCPFCGGANIEIQTSTPDREGTPTHLMCADCGAAGPWSYERGGSYTVAAALWNDRAALQQNAKHIEDLLDGKRCRALSIVSNRVLDEDRIGTEYYARQMISEEIARLVVDKHMVEDCGEGHTTFYVDVYVLTHGELQDAVAPSLQLYGA